MKCDQHPQSDAIGQCVSCGRGVCTDCKVNFNSMTHCKGCIEAGRIAGGGGGAPPGGQAGAGGYPTGGQGQSAQQYPAATPMYHQYQYQYWYPYPYAAYRPPGAPAPEISIDQWTAQSRPEPKGKPDPNFFKVGSVGCVLGAIASGIMSVGYFLWFVAPIGVAVMSFIMLFAMLPYIYGLYGFYRNYGSSAGLAGAATLLICLVLFVVLAVYSSMVPFGYSYMYYYGEASPWHTGGYVFAGIGHLVGAMGLQSARSYIYPVGHPGGTTQWSVFGIIIAGCLFLTTAGMYSAPLCLWSLLALVGWIMLAVSLFTASSIFTQAPIPKIPSEEPPLPDATITQAPDQARYP